MGFFDSLAKVEAAPVPESPREEPIVGVRGAAQALVQADDIPLERTPAQEILETTPQGVELLRRARRPPEFTEARQARFLEELLVCPNESLAALRAGITMNQVRGLKNQDAAFLQAVGEAKEFASGRVEEEAFRRSVEGVEKGVYYKGSRIDTVREYSDGLTIKILESTVPQYEKRSKVEGNINHSVKFDWMDIVQKSISESNSGIDSE